MIVSALGKSINQLSDPQFKKVFLKSVMLSAFCIICLSTIFTFLFSYFWSSLGLPFNSIVSTIGGLILFLVGMWAFSPIIAIFFNGLFQDEIISAVERKYYTYNKVENHQKLYKEINFNIKLFVKLILFNLLILPFFFIPPVYFILYWTVNGYLISYEYFSIVRMRYNNHDNIEKKIIVFIFGVIIAILFTLPVINFFAPAIAIASTVHIYKQMEKGR